MLKGARSRGRRNKIGNNPFPNKIFNFARNHIALYVNCVNYFFNLAETLTQVGFNSSYFFRLTVKSIKTFLFLF